MYVIIKLMNGTKEKQVTPFCHIVQPSTKQVLETKPRPHAGEFEGTPSWWGMLWGCAGTRTWERGSRKRGTPVPFWDWLICSIWWKHNWPECAGEERVQGEHMEIFRPEQYFKWEEIGFVEAASSCAFTCTSWLIIRADWLSIFTFQQTFQNFRLS